VLTNPEFRNHVMEFIKTHGIKVVVFDNLSMLAPGLNENDKKDYDDINQYFLALRSIGISVIVVHHTGKSGDQRGTKSREDNVDTIIYLRYPQNYNQEDGAHFNLSFAKFRGVVDDNDLIKTRELWYQKNRQNQNQYEWCFDTRIDLTQDPQFLIDVAKEGLSYDQLKDKYGVSKGTLTNKTKKLEERGMITIQGTTRNRIIELTEEGERWLGI
jgi:putative DNA primase/helicase